MYLSGNFCALLIVLQIKGLPSFKTISKAKEADSLFFFLRADVIEIEGICFFQNKTFIVVQFPPHVNSNTLRTHSP